MTLEELYNTLKDQSTINLVPDLMDSGNIFQYYSSTMPSGKFVINDAKVSATKDKEGNLVKVDIIGITDSYGMAESYQVVLCFETQFGMLCLESRCAMTGQTLEMPEVSWFGITDIEVESKIYEANMAPSGRLSGKISLLKEVVFSMNYPVQNDVWVFNANIKKPVGISNLVDLCNGAELIASLPPPLKTFLDLKVESVGLSYYNREPRRLGYINLAISSAKEWRILPMVALKEIRLSAIVDDPGSKKPRVSYAVTGYFQIGEKGTENGLINVTAAMPDLQVYGGLQAGSNLYLKDLLAIFIPGVGTSTFNSAFTSFKFVADTKNSTYNISGTLETNWDLASIGGQMLQLQSISADLQYMNGNTTGGLSGVIQLEGDIAGEDAVVMRIAAEHPKKGDGWVFSGSFEEGSKLNVKRILKSFLGTDILPEGANITISELDASFYSLTKDYSFSINIDWGNILGDHIPLTVTNTRLHIESFGGIRSGFISGIADFNGIKLELKYDCPKDATSSNILYFKIFGVEGSLTLGSSEYVLKVQPKEKSLGDIAAFLVNAAKPGSGISLPAPWDVLNNISLAGFTFIINFTKKTVGFDYDIKTNLGFASLTALSLKYEFAVKKQVLIKLEGEFLGQEMPDAWDMLNPAAAPKVPGKGNEFFDLKFLGVGQQVSIDAPPPTTVNIGVEDMITAFVKPPEQGNILRFDPSANWLIGTRFTLLKMINIDALFYDPVLYGLGVGITGGKFNGLQFEILYKKVNDNIGVYQILLAVPAPMSQMEFGAMSVTLPNVGIWIYTNGDFKIDFGFPRNGNFSGSFGIQFLPFVGSGGFYFGILSSETADQLPAKRDPKKGDFSPVIVFGIGLRMGIGKSIDKGILKAELSLTIQGIIEGTLAFFNAYPRALNTTDAYLVPANGLSGDRPIYYYVQGQLTIVGKVYGEINFAIISATLQMIVTISTRAVIEAGKAMLINFSAGISVSLKVSINLGIFSISIRLSFSTSISESFTLGSASANMPWGNISVASGSREPLLLSLTDDYLPNEIPIMNWQPIYTDANNLENGPKAVELFFASQFTVGSDHVTSEHNFLAKKPYGLAMLFIPSSASESANNSSFSVLSRGVLTWVLNAYYNKDLEHPTEHDVLNKEVSLDDLRKIYSYLCQDPSADVGNSFTYVQVIEFLSHYFKFSIALPPTNATSDPDSEIETSIFPMFPFLSLITPSGETPFGKTASIQFTQAELNEIKAYFRQLSEDGKVNQTKRYNSENRDSLAHYIFMDYFLMIAKASVQSAIDKMRSLTTEVAPGMDLRTLGNLYPGAGLGVEEIAFANRMRKLSPKTQLRVTGVRYTVRKGDNIKKIAKRFNVASLALEEKLHENVMIPGQQITLPTFIHHSLPHESLRSIAGNYGIGVNALALENADVQDLFVPGKRIVFPNVTHMNAGQLLNILEDQFAFDHLAGLAARVLLQGLRPLSPVQSVYKGLPTPLYALSLQEFDASLLTVGQEIMLKPTEAPIPWLDFGSGSSISMSITPQIVEFLDSLKDTPFNPSVKSLSSLPLSALRPKAYTLATQINWLKTDEHDGISANPSIWPFSEELRNLLIANTQPRLTLYTQVQEHDLAVADPIIIVDPIWCMKLDISVRQLPDSNKNVFELIGAGQNDCTLLKNLLTYYADSKEDLIEDIAVLYPQAPAQPGQTAPSKGLMSAPNAEISQFIIQANLSNLSHPPALVSNFKSENNIESLVGQSGIEFLKLLWECSVTGTGGFYFYYAVANQLSLPEFLFNDNPVATVTLLVTLSPNSGLPSFVNAAVIDQKIDTSNEVIFAQASLSDSGQSFIEEKISITPTGNIGFRLEREDPSLTADPNQRQLLELYNLLEYKLTTEGIFKESNPAIPAGPIDGHEEKLNDVDRNFAPPALNGDAWRYESTFPAYRFVKDIPEEMPGLPPSADNPYLAIPGPTRKYANLLFSWNDIFGNNLKIDDTQSGLWPNLAIEIGYTDEILALTKWRNVLPTYVIHAVNNVPTVEINFKFLSQRYIEIGDKEARMQNARADLAQFQTVYYQLAQPDVSLSVSTSMDRPENLIAVNEDPKQALLRFIGEIYTFLHSIAFNETMAKSPNEVAINWGIADLNPANVFLLSVSLAITRNPELVSPEFSDQPHCFTAISTIKPNLEVHQKINASGETGPLSLKEFAANFEQVFPKLKILTGPQHGVGTGQDIWVARFSDSSSGLWLAINNPCSPTYYAVRPLSVSLLSASELKVYQYVTGQNIWTSGTTTKSFNSIDMELQATAFLSAIDLFLSAKYVVQAWLLENGFDVKVYESPFKQIIDAKKEIAEAISSQLFPIFENADPLEKEILNAREALQQELLAKLSNASTINTVVQFNTTVRSKMAMKANFYGKAIEESERDVSSQKQVPYSISAAKIPISSSAPDELSQENLTFMFSAMNPQDHPSINLSLDYVVSAMEINIENVPEIKGYTSSQWLSFALPFNVQGMSTKLGQLEIPIPLKIYPTPPSVTDHEAVPRLRKTSHMPNASNNDIDALSLAKEWTYAYTYDSRGAGQDTINANIATNVTDAKRSLQNSENPDLFTALMQFADVYPAIQQDFNSYLVNGSDAQKALTAVSSFAWLVNRVAKAWRTWDIDSGLYRNNLRSIRSLDFEITQERYEQPQPLGSLNQPLLMVKITSAQEDNIPVPLIKNFNPTLVEEKCSLTCKAYVYTDESGEYLTYDKGITITQRKLQLSDSFNVLLEENASGGIAIVRNQNLGKGRKVLADFIYKTPLIRMINPARPLLHPDLAIDMAKFSSGKQPLKVFLAAFLKNLFVEVTGQESSSLIRKITFGAYYHYQPANNAGNMDAPLTIKIPIFLASPFDFKIPSDWNTEDNKSTVSRIAVFIVDWFAQNLPVRTGGTLNFSCSLYSSITDSNLPILTLDRLSLAIAEVSDL